ncbi:MAG: hypothetical protein ABI845_06155, partial [Polaromonas sp.]
HSRLPDSPGSRRHFARRTFQADAPPLMLEISGWEPFRDAVASARPRVRVQLEAPATATATAENVLRALGHQ